MDVERRLLLYVVVLGSVVGVGVLVHRRSVAMRLHGVQLAVIAVAGAAGLIREEIGAAIAWPLFAVWGLVAVVPSFLVQAAHSAASMRRYGSASRMVAVASGLLFLPSNLRREARLYAVLDAADHGNEPRCRERIAEMLAAEGANPAAETRDLARIFPSAAARRWDEVLGAVDASARRTPLIVAAEATAAAETGDVGRALRAESELAAVLPAGSHALARVRRGILSASGRASFLEEAVRTGMPVADGPPGAAPLALARAFEATGDVESALGLYRESAALSRGMLRRDADEGAERCGRGELRRARTDEGTADALHALERTCRAEPRDPGRRPLLQRAPATVLLCVATAAASSLALLVLGGDMLSLVAAGALGTPLVRGDGEWWRLGSSMLLHGGFAHMLLNLASILVVGVPYEQLVGSVRTVIVYVASGFAAAAASVYLNGTAIGVGASGAAMGIFGALAVLLLARGRMFDPSERKQWLISCVLVLVANAGIGFVERTSIDNAAHAGGLVAGALLAWWLLPAPVEYEVNRGARRMVAAALLTLLAVCAGAALGDVRHWRRSDEVHAAGVRVRVPAWMRVEEVESLGAIGSRKPVPLALQFGLLDAVAPDPAALSESVFGDDVGPLAADRWEPGEPETRTDGDLTVEDRLYRPLQERDGDAPVRVVIWERGGVFAVAVLAGDDDSREGFRAVLDRVAQSLGRVAERSE